MLYYARMSPNSKVHLITGDTGDTLHTACGRGLNGRVVAFRTYPQPKYPGELDVCVGCQRGADHFANCRHKRGGIPVTSSRLGTGKRAY